jgi:hypothetical protein
MTMSRTDVLASNRSRPRDEFIDEDELTTSVFLRTPEIEELLDSDVLLDQPSEHRWAPPSFDEVSAEEVSRSIVERIIRDLPPLAPTVDASQPLRVRSGGKIADGPNVFLARPSITEPAPPWAGGDPSSANIALPRPRDRDAASTRRVTRGKRRSLVLPFILAASVVVGVGLWLDPVTRASIVSDLARVAAVIHAL